MFSRYITFVKAINLAMDYLVLNISMVIAYYMENSEHILWLSNRRYLSIVLIFNLTWFLSASLVGLYEHILNHDSIKIFRNVIKAYFLFVSLICTILVMVGTKAYFITRGYIIDSSLLFGFLLALWKLIFLSIRKVKRTMLFDIRRVVIVGNGGNGSALQDFFKYNPHQGYRLVGFFCDNQEMVKEKDLYLGQTSKCIEYVLNNKIDEIFCTLGPSEVHEIEQLIVNADKHLIRFRFVPEYYNYGIKNSMIQTLGQHIAVIPARSEPQEIILNRIFKRAFDIVFSIFIIVFFLSWLLPLLAILIKMQSKGPVFFKQLRSGRDNKPFMCYKFRSMRENNESDKKQAKRDDHRITKIGAFMRRTSLDELPQFFNVLIGNMSTVGPRPHMIHHTEQYAQLIDRYMARHFLKPGITGWAQIQGFRGETPTTESMLKRVEADVWYLENWSFLLDLKIIFSTIWISVKGDTNAF